jgi:hypothetical protein
MPFLLIALGVGGLLWFLKQSKPAPGTAVYAFASGKPYILVLDAKPGASPDDIAGDIEHYNGVSLFDNAWTLNGTPSMVGQTAAGGEAWYYPIHANRDFTIGDLEVATNTGAASAGGLAVVTAAMAG